MIDIAKIHQKYNTEIDFIHLLASFKIHDIDRYVEQYRDKIKPSENPALKSAYNFMLLMREKFESLLEQTKTDSEQPISQYQANVIYNNCEDGLYKAIAFIEKNIDLA